MGQLEARPEAFYDAKMAHLVISMTADTQALDAAWAAGNITSEYRNAQIKATRQRYALLLRNLVLGPQDEPGDKNDE